MPYTQLQQLTDNAAPWGVNCYEKALYLHELSDEAIAVISEYQALKISPRSMWGLIRLGGAYGAVGEEETAFGGSRLNRIGISMLGLTEDVELLAAERAWVRSFWEALRPHAAGAGGYLNWMAEFEEDRVRVPTGRSSTSGLLGSSPSTTRTTSSTSMPTSNPRYSRSDECRVLVAVPEGDSVSPGCGRVVPRSL